MSNWRHCGIASLFVSAFFSLRSYATSEELQVEHVQRQFEEKLASVADALSSSSSSESASRGSGSGSGPASGSTNARVHLATFATHDVFELIQRDIAASYGTAGFVSHIAWGGRSLRAASAAELEEDEKADGDSEQGKDVCFEERLARFKQMLDRLRDVYADEPRIAEHFALRADLLVGTADLYYNDTVEQTTGHRSENCATNVALLAQMEALLSSASDSKKNSAQDIIATLLRAETPDRRRPSRSEISEKEARAKARLDVTQTLWWKTNRDFFRDFLKDYQGRHFYLRPSTLR